MEGGACLHLALWIGRRQGPRQLAGGLGEDATDEPLPGLTKGVDENILGEGRGGRGGEGRGGEGDDKLQRYMVDVRMNTNSK